MAKGITGLTDSELLDVANQVLATATPVPAIYGTDAPGVMTLSVIINTFQTDVAAQVAAIAASKTATVTKEASRTALENALRSFRDVAKTVATEPQITALGLPTASAPAPANATVPVAMIDTSERFRHTISWTDAAANGNKKKPRGAMGAEIWVKIGDPAPVGEADCTFLTLDAFTPYVSDYPAADANKTAHYMIRWRMRDGSVSAWGETVSATITG